VRPRLVVFAKAPLMGYAKTRLAASRGRAEALRRYRAMTARILRNVRDPRWRTVLAVAPDGWADAELPLWPADLSRMPQGDGDLGARQARIFATPMTVVIGTDAPDVSARDIAAAFGALRRNEAVLGPAEDGGYWLLGLKRAAAPGLFDGVRWSTRHALADLEGNLPTPPVRLRALADMDA